MWDRRMIKGYAKQELKQSYWLSFGVCIVAGILGAGGNGISYNFGGSGSGDSWLSDGSYFSNFDFDQNLAAIIAVVFAAVVIAVLIAAAVSIFLTNPIQVGKCSFFARAPYGDRQFGNLFSSFKNGRYMSIVKTMFMTYLYIFLWSLLFWIPGIVKSYQYRMVPYIISDDPSLTPSQAMDLSRRMTDGEKGSMFVLDLSFIGWYLLGCIALGIGVLFVNPYAEATWAQLYFILRMKVTNSTQNGPYPPEGQYPPQGYYPPENQYPPEM